MDATSAFAVTPTNNPFPAEAVSTYGRPRAVDVAELSYMHELRSELERYLAAHPREDARFGGAIGISGGHGSGKTHVLGWLADSLRNRRSIGSSVLYAKCDSPRFFDLYRQLIEGLDRAALNGVIQLALLSLARSKVMSAKITESLASELETTGGLQKLQAAQDLDLEQLRQQLVNELSIAGPSEMVRVLMDITHPRFGIKAHQWISGMTIDGLSELGLTNQLNALPGPGAASSPGAPEAPSESAMDSVIKADLNAIAALGVIAALHRFAGVPLLVLVDQLEVLVGPGDQAPLTMGSLLKKFVEQLQSQACLAVIAGVPRSWLALPRDVPPRFRRRDPVVVGNLTVEETRAFLRAYTSQRPNLVPFTPAMGATMRHLAGGSPREVLRIAHQAYELTNGQLAATDGSTLLRAAQHTGSIEDRARMALATADDVLASFGKVTRDLSADAAWVADRAVLDPDGTIIVVLMLVRATDALDEIDSARRVRTALAHKARQAPHAEFVVVAVGYSSSAVHDALQLESAPILFDEKTFEAELRSRLVAVGQRVPQAPAAGPLAASGQPSSYDLDEIAKRLESLERMRTTEAQRVKERFSAETQVLARPIVEERRLTTRREILDALDSLESARAQQDTNIERNLLRSVLVANEAHLRDQALDDLGEVYLEVLALERYALEETRETLEFERDRLIRDMRDSVRNSRTVEAVFSLRRLPWLVASALAAFVGFGILSVQEVNKKGPKSDQEAWLGTLFLPPPNDFVTILPFMALAVAGIAAYAWTLVMVADRVRRRRLRERIEDLRRRFQREKSALRERYPQSS